MINSNGQGHRISAEVDRDHETLEFAHQAPANKRSHAEHEYGNDEGNRNQSLQTGLLLKNSCYQAGIMDDMMEDMLDAEEDEEIEQEADAEVDKVLFELTNGKLGQAGTVGTELPVCYLSPVFFCTDTLCTVRAGAVGGRGDRTCDGTIPPAAERYT